MEAIDRWYTTEDPPRQLTVKGRSGIDPDCLVAENPDGGSPLWIVDDGSDTKVLCFIAGAPYQAIRVKHHDPR